MKSELSDVYLVQTSPLYSGLVFTFFYTPQTHIRNAWELDKKRATNYSLSNKWLENTVQDEMACQMANYFKAFSKPYALALAEKINLKQQFGVETLLDVAGGTGMFR